MITDTKTVLLDRFRAYIKESGIISDTDKIMLAVSGGVDSMVMMHLFSASNYNIGVAHCNFCLRGTEADEDEAIVEEYAKKLNLEHFNIRFDTMAEVDASGESTQMVARRLRYDWFNQICIEHGYDKISIAHHADDSIETFFINLIRGTGLRGLTGISVTNGRIVRPLLFATRKEILEYAVANNIKYREDSSNSSTKYLRNKIRLGIIPRIKEISPNFGSTMTANVERLSTVSVFVNRQIEIIREQITVSENNQDIIDLSLIDDQLPVNYVIYEMLQPYGFNADVIGDLDNCLKNGTSGRRFYSISHVAYLDRNKIVVMRISENDECIMTIDKEIKRESCMGNLLSFENIEIEDIESLNQPENIALLDASLIKFPLTVRRWKEGDSFVPFGMTGHKKLSDFLIDSKVAVPDKDRQLVVLSGNDIVWVIGRRIDDRYRITDTTTDILRITRIEIENN